MSLNIKPPISVTPNVTWSIRYQSVLVYNLIYILIKKLGKIKIFEPSNISRSGYSGKY
jgi:hypothetical protein